MMITNVANAGGAGGKPQLVSAKLYSVKSGGTGAGVKPLLESTNTVTCQG